MARPRDNQRKRLYDSEKDLGQGPHRIFRAVEGVKEYVESIMRSHWFQDHFPDVTSIEVTDGRRRRNAAAQRFETHTWEIKGVIKMPKWSRIEIVILHEIAHVVTPNHFAAHGLEFATNFLALTKHALGVDAYNRLRARFLAKGVKFHEA